ncbi:MAG: molybdenum cofactor guanylyltransferase [Pseudomonadales bacterium]|jgi:molybdopterin-guanine dinucleotide biosynthesis protein A|tara:strand:+ start:1726 stop:2310 length:585 start_codon:yes stop_codon:yes gene_type:complete
MNNDFSTIILAGGKGQRMGGQDKGLVHYQGHPLIHQSLLLARQCTRAIVISANRNIPQYQSLADVVIKDNLPDYGGPLFGIQACATSVSTDYTLIMACDLPRLTSDLVQNLQRALFDPACEFDAVVYRQGGFLQCGLIAIKTPVLTSIDAELLCGQQSVRRWLEALPLLILDSHDAFAFTNFNVPGNFTADPST